MLKKLTELINSGADIEFSVRGKQYTILSWTEDGIVIGPKNSDNDMVFRDADELYDQFLIDGVPLRKMIDQITIEFSSL